MPITLIVDGKPRPFISIKTFREQYHLPAQFGVGSFQPKNWSGLGSIDSAASALIQLRDRVMGAVPTHLKPARLLSAADDISAVFLAALYEINPAVGLKPVEIDFAGAGFNDVLRAWVYALSLYSLKNDPSTVPDFRAVYMDWLNQSVRIASPVYEYAVGDQVWGVQVIVHAYGRMGLLVARDETHTDYVYDPALACPAEGFMATLLEHVCASIGAAAGIGADSL